MGKAPGSLWGQGSAYRRLLKPIEKNLEPTSPSEAHKKNLCEGGGSLWGQAGALTSPSDAHKKQLWRGPKGAAERCRQAPQVVNDAGKFAGKLVPSGAGGPSGTTFSRARSPPQLAGVGGYIYIHTYIHTDARTYIHTYIHTLKIDSHCNSPVMFWALKFVEFQFHHSISGYMALADKDRWWFLRFHPIPIRVFYPILPFLSLSWQFFFSLHQAEGPACCGLEPSTRNRRRRPHHLQLC